MIKYIHTTARNQADVQTKQFLVEGQWVTKEEKTNNLEKCGIKLQFMMIIVIMM